MWEVMLFYLLCFSVKLQQMNEKLMYTGNKNDYNNFTLGFAKWFSLRESSEAASCFSPLKSVPNFEVLSFELIKLDLDLKYCMCR